MATACFQREIQANYVKPRIKFTYAGTDYSSHVKSITNLVRDDKFSSQNVTVVIQDTLAFWDSLFRTDHTELTKKCVISLAIGDLRSYTASTISFHENSPAVDMIEDSADGLTFTDNTVVAITGSASNNKSVMIEGTTASVLSLDNSDDLTDEAESAEVTLTNELLTLYTGYVEDADISYSNGEITLKLRDRISLLLESPFQYVSAGQLVNIAINTTDIVGVNRYNEMTTGTMVWDILTNTNYPNALNATESTANPDIDWDSFSAWKTAVDALDYDIAVFATGGPSRANILSGIAKATVSQIWVGANGKLKFKGSTQTVAGNIYTTANVIDAFNMDIKMDGRINSYTVRWGFAPAIDAWVSDGVGVYAHSHNVGPTDVPYTYTSEIIQDRDVSHNTAASATKFVDEALLITAAPVRQCRLGMNLYGFLEDVGNEITLENFYGEPYDSIEVHLEKVTFDPNNMIATLEGYYLWGGGELA